MSSHFASLNFNPTGFQVIVPGAIHALHGQTMEWIFNHGAYAVVTTSQLHTRGETSPIPSDTLSRAFAVPAPPPSLSDDAEFTITYESPTSQFSDPLEFEHWSEDMLCDDSDDDSDDNSELEDDMHGQLVIEIEPVSILSYSNNFYSECVLELRCNARS